MKVSNAVALAPLLPVTPPRNTTTYTNNPYSFENFTPPPLEIGRIRFGQEEVPLEEIETDQHKIQQRQKQIGFGKSTKGYEPRDSTKGTPPPNLGQ